MDKKSQTEFFLSIIIIHFHQKPLLGLRTKGVINFSTNSSVISSCLLSIEKVVYTGIVKNEGDFTIGEVSELCGIKSHVLRYWEQEFPDLKPMKRRGNRRYYQRQDVVLIRQIRSLLHEQGYTINAARQKLSGEEAVVDSTQANQLSRQIITELEELLKILKKK